MKTYFGPVEYVWHSTNEPEGSVFILHRAGEKEGLREVSSFREKTHNGFDMGRSRLPLRGPPSCQAERGGQGTSGQVGRHTDGGPDSLTKPVGSGLNI